MNSPPNARRAWIYARVSTRKKSQAESPGNQLRRLAKIAELKGWKVVGRGADRVSSAKAADLVELARGLKAMQSATANVLMIADLDRLGGTMAEILSAAKTIDELGAHLYIESCQIDTTQGGPIGRFFFHTLAAFSELRRTLQNDKIKRGMETARARGSKIGRPRKHYVSSKLVTRAIEIRRGPPAAGWREMVRQLKAEKFKGVPSHPTLRRWVLGSATLKERGEMKINQATKGRAP